MKKCLVSYNSGNTEFLLPLTNYSESNFEDEIRLTFLVNGEEMTYTRRMSVYDHCNVDYHIQIPTSKIQFQPGNFELLSVTYYETCLGQWKTLEVANGTEGGGVSTGIQQMPDEIVGKQTRYYDMAGRIVTKDFSGFVISKDKNGRVRKYQSEK